MDTNDLLEFKLATPRLTLVPISPAYREDIFREFTPELTVFMTPKPPRNISDTDEFIETSLSNMKKGEEIVCAILKNPTNEFLGVAALHRVNVSTPELGVWVKKSAHGNGYGREAMAALKEWADKHIKYEYITYPVAADNRASRKIVELLGGKLVREFEQENNAGVRMPWTEYRIYKSD